jgi:hypothetical protein
VEQAAVVRDTVLVGEVDNPVGHGVLGEGARRARRIQHAAVLDSIGIKGFVRYHRYQLPDAMSRGRRLEIAIAAGEIQFTAIAQESVVRIAAAKFQRRPASAGRRRLIDAASTNGS